jgi:hypothetical protein
MPAKVQGHHGDLELTHAASPSAPVPGHKPGSFVLSPALTSY